MLFRSDPVILRRHGNALHSVVPHFDSKALTEIGFRRDQERAEARDEFDAAHERVREHALDGQAEGFVQDEVERVLLADLLARLTDLERGLSAGEVLVVESEQGVDYPKTHTHQKTVVVEGENWFHFTTTVHPPLRVGLYRRKGMSA